MTGDERLSSFGPPSTDVMHHTANAALVHGSLRGHVIFPTSNLQPITSTNSIVCPLKLCSRQARCWFRFCTTPTRLTLPGAAPALPPPLTR